MPSGGRESFFKNKKDSGQAGMTDYTIMSMLYEQIFMTLFPASEYTAE
jgi:hypothetical protein